MLRRRATLRVLAAGGTLGVSGCASVVRRIGARRRAPPNDGYPPPTTQAGTQTKPITSRGDPGTTTPQSAYRVSPPTGYLTDAPFPSNPSAFPYARMGAADAEVVTLYGSWKCPVTREFVVQDLPDLARAYVDSRRVAIRFRALAYQGGQPYLGPDSPRAAWAGLAVWTHDPSSYWAYFATVFQNQPPERDEWATLDTLQQFLRRADVGNLNAVIEDVYDAERDELVRATSDAADRLGIKSLPRLAYDGEVVAPNDDTGAVRELFERAGTGGTSTTGTRTTTSTGTGASTDTDTSKGTRTGTDTSTNTSPSTDSRTTTSIWTTISGETVDENNR